MAPLSAAEKKRINDAKKIDLGRVRTLRAEEKLVEAMATANYTAMMQEAQIEAFGLRTAANERYVNAWIYYGQYNAFYESRLKRSKDAANHNNSGHIGFFTLPPELRNRIYDLTIPQFVPVASTNGTGPLKVDDNKRHPILAPMKQAQPDLAISRVCKQLRIETINICRSRLYLRYVNHDQEDARAVERWLSTVAPVQLQMAKTIEIEVHTDGPTVCFRLMSNIYSATVDGYRFVNRDGVVERAESEVVIILGLVKKYVPGKAIRPPASRPVIHYKILDRW